MTYGGLNKNIFQTRLVCLYTKYYVKNEYIKRSIEDYVRR